MIDEIARLRATYAAHDTATNMVRIQLLDHLAQVLNGEKSAPPKAGAQQWVMGEAVNPKNLGDMRWTPYEEALNRLNVNTFLGRWRVYDEQGAARPDRDRIAFCCQNDHGDVLALGDDAEDGEQMAPTWRVVDEPDEILVPFTQPNAIGDIGTTAEGWQPRIGDPVEVTEEVLRRFGEWARVPLWVVGIQKDRGVDGLNVAVSEEWPVRSNSHGYTDGFYIGRSVAPDDLKPRAMTSPEALKGGV